MNKSPFPSITGFDAKAPIFPKPKTAVPFEITATKFPLDVYRYESSGFFAISKQGYATPGEYARDNSLAVECGFVGTIFIFPLGLFRDTLKHAYVNFRSSELDDSISKHVTQH